MYGLLHRVNESIKGIFYYYHNHDNVVKCNFETKNNHKNAL